MERQDGPLGRNPTAVSAVKESSMTSSATPSRVSRLVEVGTTLLTVVTCLAVCGFVFLEVSEKRARSAAAPKLEVGTVLSPVGDLAYSDSEVTLLAGLSSKCQYCTESVPALRQAEEYARSVGDQKFRVVAVGLEPMDVLSQYVQQHGLSRFRPYTINRGTDVAVLVSRTPSFALVDRKGAVLTYWTGKTSTEQMGKILRRLPKEVRAFAEPAASIVTNR
jgi:hypothetical protein